MECIDNIGFPTSTVRKPSLLNIGPTVEPQALCDCVNRGIEVEGVNGYQHIIPDFKFLNFSTLALDEFPHQEGTNRVAGITLFGVGLDHDTMIHPRLVIGLKLGFVIGMDRVAHITGNQKRPRDRLTIRRRSGRKSFDERWD